MDQIRGLFAQRARWLTTEVAIALRTTPHIASRALTRLAEGEEIRKGECVPHGSTKQRLWIRIDGQR